MPRRPRLRSTAVGFLLIAMPFAVAADPDATEFATWREAREARLRADNGWLSLVGLFWLDEGENSFGASREARVVLPEDAGPEHAGVFERKGDAVTLRLADGVTATVDDVPFRARALRTDAAGAPELVRLGRISFSVIARGERLGVRMRDPESPARREFGGCDWFAPRADLRVRARFERYDPPRTLAIPNVLGDLLEESCPGVAIFEVDGRKCRLEPTIGDPETGELFFVFGDASNGVSTYPGGRFLDADAPVNGTVLLDFNRAVNPPCAFTAFATCPLPPESNRLPVALEAGERFDGEHP